MGSGLSRREREIVDIVYASEEGSAAEIRAAMADSPADATVRTLLRILVEKGVLTHRRDGRRYLYRPKKPKSGAGKTAMKRVLDVFYGGSVESALAAHLSDPTTKLDDQQIQRLRRLIDRAAERGEES